MKRILIVVSLILIGIYGLGKYQDYSRYHSDTIVYKKASEIDLEYFNQDIVKLYFKSIEELNSFVSLQWFANKIDVLKPKKEDEVTKNAVLIYAEKKAEVKYYESKLQHSFDLKKKNLSNKEIKSIIEEGVSLKLIKKEEDKALLRELFKRSKDLSYGAKGELVFEIQKLLVSKGYKIPIDGFAKKATQDAIKDFEQKNNLFPDGVVDLLMFEKLLLN